MENNFFLNNSMKTGENINVKTTTWKFFFFFFCNWSKYLQSIFIVTVYKVFLHFYVFLAYSSFSPAGRLAIWV